MEPACNDMICDGAIRRQPVKLGLHGSLLLDAYGINLRSATLIAKNAPAACEVVRRSISKLCSAEHYNDPVIVAW
jgi:hypothetical protein